MASPDVDIAVYAGRRVCSRLALAGARWGAKGETLGGSLLLETQLADPCLRAASTGATACDGIRMIRDREALE